MQSKILENDINRIVSTFSLLSELKGSTVLITGSTGLIGSILVKTFIKYGNIKVYAACRSEKKFQTVFSEYFCNNLIPLFSDITNINISEIDLDYIIHTASITDSQTFVKAPVQTLNTAIDGTRNLLEQCINKKLKTFVYLSSLEVYGSFESDEIKNVKEKDYGYIEPLSVRSSYSEGKRIVENYCISYMSQFGIPVKIARLCQTFGPGVEYNDNRVFAQFARSVIEGKDIILKTKGETVRNYCYTSDAVTGLITIMVKGENGQAYNIANMETTISIVDMANLVTTLLPESKSKLLFDIAPDATKLGYNPIMKIQIDSSKLQALGWKTEVPLKEMFIRLIQYMKDINA